MHTVTQTSLYGKDLLTLKDLSEEDINALLAEAGELKQNKIQPIFHGKTLAMILKNHQRGPVFHLKRAWRSWAGAPSF